MQDAGCDEEMEQAKTVMTMSREEYQLSWQQKQKQKQTSGTTPSRFPA